MSSNMDQLENEKDSREKEQQSNTEGQKKSPIVIKETDIPGRSHKDIRQGHRAMERIVGSLVDELDRLASQKDKENEELRKGQMVTEKEVARKDEAAEREARFQAKKEKERADKKQEEYMQHLTVENSLRKQKMDFIRQKLKEFEEEDAAKRKSTPEEIEKEKHRKEAHALADREREKELGLDQLSKSERKALAKNNVVLRDQSKHTGKDHEAHYADRFSRGDRQTLNSALEFKKDVTKNLEASDTALQQLWNRLSTYQDGPFKGETKDKYAGATLENVILDKDSYLTKKYKSAAPGTEAHNLYELASLARDKDKYEALLDVINKQIEKLDMGQNRPKDPHYVNRKVKRSDAEQKAYEKFLNEEFGEYGVSREQARILSQELKDNLGFLTKAPRTPLTENPEKYDFNDASEAVYKEYGSLNNITSKLSNDLSNAIKRNLNDDVMSKLFRMTYDNKGNIIARQLKDKVDYLPFLDDIKNPILQQIIKGPLGEDILKAFESGELNIPEDIFDSVDEINSFLAHEKMDAMKANTRDNSNKKDYEIFDKNKTESARELLANLLQDKYLHLQDRGEDGDEIDWLVNRINKLGTGPFELPPEKPKSQFWGQPDILQGYANRLRTRANRIYRLLGLEEDPDLNPVAAGEAFDAIRQLAADNAVRQLNDYRAGLYDSGYDLFKPYDQVLWEQDKKSTAQDKEIAQLDRDVAAIRAQEEEKKLAQAQHIKNLKAQAEAEAFNKAERAAFKRAMRYLGDDFGKDSWNGFRYATTGPAGADNRAIVDDSFYSPELMLQQINENIPLFTDKMPYIDDTNGWALNPHFFRTLKALKNLSGSENPIRYGKIADAFSKIANDDVINKAIDKEYEEDAARQAKIIDWNISNPDLPPRTFVPRKIKTPEERKQIFKEATMSTALLDALRASLSDRKDPFNHINPILFNKVALKLMPQLYTYLKGGNPKIPEDAVAMFKTLASNIDESFPEEMRRNKTTAESHAAVNKWIDEILPLIIARKYKTKSDLDNNRLMNTLASVSGPGLI